MEWLQPETLVSRALVPTKCCSPERMRIRAIPGGAKKEELF